VTVSLALAFAAGLLSFASPCVLALVPVYLTFLGESAGAAAAIISTEGDGERSAAQPRLRAADGRAMGIGVGGSVLGQALLFVLGFTAVFVLLGTSAGLLGAALFRDAVVRQLAGALVIGLGLLTMGVSGPVMARLSVAAPGMRALPPGRVARALALGALVSIGWTPCIGPVLATILTMGATSRDAPAAALLLVGYSAGLAVPFLAAAVALPRLRPAMTALRRHHRLIEVAAGLFLVAIGVLIVTNAFSTLAGLFTWTL
jgi:cytochrome c-type biogenesis protein